MLNFYKLRSIFSNIKFFLFLVFYFNAITVFSQDAIKLTFAGDLMAHTPNQMMKDYSDIYNSLIPILQSDDLSFINLETPVDQDQPISNYPNFNAHSAYVEAAIKAGFNVFSLANNHSNDFGLSSVKGTLKTLKSLAAKYPIFYSGLKEEKNQDVSPVLIRKKNWTIGFIALTNILNTPDASDYINFYSYHDPWTKQDYPVTRQKILDIIVQSRKLVDLLVVSFHDGMEYEKVPRDWQVKFYNEMSSYGADILWVEHPHVLQPWTWVETPRGKRVILYSMGNFISSQTMELGPQDGQTDRANTGDSCLMQISLIKNGSDITFYKMEPLYYSQYKDPQKGIIVIPTQLWALSGPEAWRDYYSYRLKIEQKWGASGNNADQ